MALWQTQRGIDLALATAAPHAELAALLRTLTDQTLATQRDEFAAILREASVRIYLLDPGLAPRPAPTAEPAHATARHGTARHQASLPTTRPTRSTRPAPSCAAATRTATTSTSASTPACCSSTTASPACASPPACRPATTNTTASPTT